MDQAEQKKPKHAPIVNVRGINASAFAKEAFNQKKHACTEGKRKNSAHFSIGEHFSNDPREQIPAGAPTCDSWVPGRGMRKAEFGDVHQEDAKQSETANSVKGRDAFLEANRRKRAPVFYGERRGNRGTRCGREERFR